MLTWAALYWAAPQNWLWARELQPVLTLSRAVRAGKQVAARSDVAEGRLLAAHAPRLACFMLYKAA